MTHFKSAAIIAGALLLAMTHTSSAQRFGVTFGKTSSDIVNIDNSSSSSSYPDRESAALGISYRHRIAQRTVLQPELLLVRRGWSENHPTLQLTYVELPMVLRYGAVPRAGFPIRPILTAGASVSYVTHCSLTNLDRARAEGAECEKQIVGPYNEDYTVNRWDVGALLGAGIEARGAGGIVVGFEARYEVGLMNARRLPGTSSHNTTSFFMVTITPGFDFNTSPALAANAP